ncbi:hypothetical protein ACFQZC_02590 [Streptacidiphilus monticola]
MPARELDPDLPEKPPPAWAAQVAVRIMPSMVTRQPRSRQVALAGFSLGLLAAGLIGGWGVGSALAPTPPSGDVAQAGAASPDVSPAPAPRGQRAGARSRCYPTPEQGRPRHPCP